MTMHQQRMHRDNEARLGVLENEVGSIKSALGEIKELLSARAGINWAPIALLISVLGMVGSMGFAWINQGQGRLEMATVKLDERLDRFVPRPELEDKFRTYGEKRDTLQHVTDARIERTERDIDGLQKAVVPRGEHQETWAGQRTKDDALQRQIDSLRADLSGLNTPRDTMQAIQRRLDELERRRGG